MLRCSCLLFASAVFCASTNSNFAVFCMVKTIQKLIVFCCLTIIPDDECSRQDECDNSDVLLHHATLPVRKAFNMGALQ